MARSGARRKPKPRTQARLQTSSGVTTRSRSRAATRPEYRVAEDAMFFPRLRRHAKWMFVFLALVFAVGFVGFGVGAGGTGIGDILRGGTGSGAPSADDA